MLNERLEEILANVWEALVEEDHYLSSLEIVEKTGLSVPEVLVALNKMSEIGIVSIKEHSKKKFKALKNIDSLTYAKAIEIGIPILSLENTVGLSDKNRSEVENLILSGRVDDEKMERQEIKKEKRKEHLYGRAASRAAQTDLAQIISDTEKACNDSGNSNFIKMEIASEARRSLDALIKAMVKDKK